MAAVQDTGISVAPTVRALAVRTPEPELLATRSALEPAAIRAALLSAARLVQT
jgi:uncharacterized protein (DUF433 family)